MEQRELDIWHMRRALELALQGQGFVEPNPMVGCVIARGAEIIGEGWHRRFGAAHAEIEALRLAGVRAQGASVYVTLEPCCHQGKTPPCTQALIQAKPARLVAAMSDPFPEVSGRGLEELRRAGIAVETGLLQAEARELNAPYLKLIETGRPWVIAKWAMTLDGKIATHTGASRWITSQAARAVVHRLRGRVDGVMVGRHTAQRDDPLLTARPPGARTATRIVLDSRASLSSESRLARTAGDVPVLVAAGPDAEVEQQERLRRAGCEVFVCPGHTPDQRLDALLAELGRRRMTNLLVEGGAKLLGSLLDARAIDELHVFIAPKLIGGAEAIGPVAGRGVAELSDALQLESPRVEQIGPDVYLAGRMRRAPIEQASAHAD